MEIADPDRGQGREPAAQGIAKGALQLQAPRGRPHGGRWFYFTETEDDTACGRIWRIDRDGHVGGVGGGVELAGSSACRTTSRRMPAGDMFVTEDRNNASAEDPNQVIFIDRKTGEMAVFAELAFQLSTPEENLADEPTGPAFSTRRACDVPQLPASARLRSHGCDHGAVRLIRQEAQERKEGPRSLSTRPSR